MLTRPYVALCGAATLATAMLLVYSQTEAFAWDEGFHLLAAQLIGAGRRPYLDFIFSQTPLNAYWNAGWMTVFGETWRVAHAVAALCTGIATFLVTDYLYRYFPLTEWRMAAALSGLLLTGLNIAVVQFGTIAQAYGLCLLLIVGAFRCAVAAAGSRRSITAFAAGLASSAAANASLLTAPVAPVLLVWLWIASRSGNRRRKTAAFLAGALAACVPFLLLLAASPRHVLFGVLDYNFRYRGVRWEDATPHNVEVMLAWIDSFPAVALILLAAVSIRLWRQRPELTLCAALAAALTLHISTAHPTFERYYLFAVPFSSVLAVAGLHRVAALFARPWLPVALLAFLLLISNARMAFLGRADFNWRDFEPVAAKLREVVPANAPFVADEHLYFLLGRLPPPGMELEDSHKLQFPPGVAEPLHVLPETELIRRIQARRYAAVETCDDGKIEKFGLADVFAEHWKNGECAVYWGFR